jgi:hypothetical protein
MKFLEDQHRNKSNGAQHTDKGLKSHNPEENVKDKWKTQASFSDSISSFSHKYAAWQLQQTVTAMTRTVAEQYKSALRPETQQKVVGILLSEDTKAQKAAKKGRDKRRVHFRLPRQIESRVFQVWKAGLLASKENDGTHACIPVPSIEHAHVCVL